MIIVDGKAIVEAEEKDALLHGMTFAQQAGIAYEDMMKAVSLLVLEMQKPEDDPASEEQEFKPLPASYRCRICGRRYVYKGEARACERDHNRPWK